MEGIMKDINFVIDNWEFFSCALIFYCTVFFICLTKEKHSLEELGEILLKSYRDISKLPIPQRFEAKKKWDKSLENYLKRCEFEGVVPKRITL